MTGGAPPRHRISISSSSGSTGPAKVRFSVEGGGPRAVVCASPSPPAVAAAAVAATAPILRAQMREAGPPWSTTLNTPTAQWYQGGTQKPQVMELPTPAVINSSCLSVDGGVVTVDGPGMLYTSRDNGTSWDAGTTAEYYQAVAVAFGMRPYINEVNGTLLLAVDSALLTQLQLATAAERAAVSVTLRLPFVSAPAARTVIWRGGQLLQRAQTVLSFSLVPLPATVNQDVMVEISLPHSRTIRKFRRLMRAPRLPSGSFVQPVQVDHSTRSLRVDGRPFNGIGWYLDGLDAFGDGSPGFATFTNLTQFIVHSQTPSGVNHGMIYRLFTFSAERQLSILDQLTAGGFKVWYEVGKQLNVCGDGTRAPEKVKQCFNDSNTLGWLKKNVELVKDHPAILGYIYHHLFVVFRAGNAGSTETLYTW
jgi:hypothetical protein